MQLLTLHYERCGRYYGSVGGQGTYGSASEEEKRLTMMLFTNIFDSLSKMVCLIMIWYLNRYYFTSCWKLIFP